MWPAIYAIVSEVLPRYHQHISCPTRGGNLLDHMYTPFWEGHEKACGRIVSLVILRLFVVYYLSVVLVCLCLFCISLW